MFPSMGMHVARELVEAAQQAHDDRNALVMLGGADLVKWATLFLGLEDNVPLGNGNSVTHAFRSVDLAKRIMSLVSVPGVDVIMTRELTETELMLEEEIRAKRQMDGIASEEEEDEDDEDDEGDDDGDDEEADY